MTVYCDRLRLSMTAAILRDRLAGRVRPGEQVLLLDRPPAGVVERAGAALLRRLGLRVAEVEFFAGHLRSVDGEAVAVVARKEAFALADRAAAHAIEHLPILRRINGTWGRETLRLWIAKQVWLHAEAMLMRALSADALAVPGSALLRLRWPSVLPRGLSAELPLRHVVFRPAGTARPGWKSGRWSPSLWALRDRLLGRRLPAGDPAADTGPALMVPLEDDLSADRSLRSQPHWLDDAPAPFRTVVMRMGRTADASMTAEERAARRIELTGPADVAAARAPSPVGAEAGRDAWRLAAEAALTRSSATSFAAAQSARLLMSATDLASFCSVRRVKAFMTCENYAALPAAMQLIAPRLGIATLAYQYANMPNPSLPMVSTADRFVVFSPLFASRFVWPGYPAPVFDAAGYPFPSTDPALRARAAARRRRLEAAGARFVVGFFDESVQRNKYGWVHQRDYASDLLQMLDLVRQDSSVGLIIKTQFHHNMEGMPDDVHEPLAAAIRTGRVELPSAGRHRNSVLPAEVALSSDIVIGHAFGGTASLESALAGCRSLLINACGQVTAHDALYARADILRGSMGEALASIADWRAGQPQAAAVGDWTPILPELDAFRDNRGAERMRALLTETVCAS